MNINDRNILGKTNLEVSPIAYGGIISMNEAQSDSDRYVAFAIDSGINYFDVAPGYGNAQQIMGVSLKPYRKDNILACKTGEMSRETGEKQIQESFKLLHTDYFDVFQLHGLTTFESLELAFSDKGIMEYLVKAKKEGNIRNIGFSAHNEDVALKALELFDFDTVLFPFNWGTYAGKNFGERILKAANERNMGKLALKALAHRSWKDDDIRKYAKCWYKPIDIDNRLALSAMKFTMSLGVDLIVPPGHFEYLKFAIENYETCMNNPLNDEDMLLLKKELEIVKNDLIF